MDKTKIINGRKRLNSYGEILTYICLINSLALIFFMGDNFFNILLLSNMYLISVTIIYFIVFRILNRLEIDFEKRRFKKIFSRMDFSHLSRIEMITYENELRIRFYNKKNQYIGVNGLDDKDKEYYDEFLKNNFKEIPLKNLSWRSYKKRVLTGILVFLIFSYSIFHVYFSIYRSSMMIYPEKSHWKISRMTETNCYLLDDFSFELPEKYAVSRIDKKHSMEFTGKDDKFIFFISDKLFESITEKRFKIVKQINNLFGHGKSFKIISYIFNGKYGVFPIISKYYLFKYINVENVFSYVENNSKGYVLVLKKKKNDFALIISTDSSEKRFLLTLITDYSLKKDESLLKKIIGSIRICRDNLKISSIH